MTAAVRFILGIAALALSLCAAACSDSKPATGPTVTLVFENVRKGDGRDDWNAVAAVLAEHSKDPVRPEFGRHRKVGNAEVRDAKVTLRLERFGDLDEIEEDLGKVGKSEGGGSWFTMPFRDEKPRGYSPRFALSEANVRYSSNFVLSGVSVTVSGITARNNEVTLILGPESVVKTRADSRGLWRAPVTVLPESNYIYGESVGANPASARYFRISTTTFAHEDISEGEYEKHRPRVSERGEENEKREAKEEKKKASKGK